MLITVAINTWNRADLLAKTLDQITRVEVPAGIDWELVLVNNNCTDGTDDVVAAFSGRLPIRYIREPRQGTSFAKNAAVEATHGELMLWTDDDVIVDRNWMRAYLDAFTTYTDVSIFGGTIRPWLPEAGRLLPKWATNSLDIIGPLWALRDFGPSTRPLKMTEEVYGANMAFRTSILKQYRFDTNLGDVGGKIRKGEEAELIYRMRQDGHKAVWVGSAEVQHYLLPARVSRRYVWEVASNVRGAGYKPEDDVGVARLGRVPRYLIRKYCVARLKSLLLAPFGTRAWALAYLEAAAALGSIRAARRSAQIPETTQSRPT